MKQNKYDDPEFFARYSEMPRSLDGLEAAGEWPVFRSLLPELRGKRLLDLGCGYGWHCRYAREQQADFVMGVDISEKMLARARENTADTKIEYRCSAVEDIDFAAGEFDVVMSSLAFHYVEHFDVVCRKVHHCLAPGGAFVFSVEHPIFTALPAQQWYLGSNGERLHWPVDDYQREGIRHTQWLSDDDNKYHRTVATYVNTLLDSGFQISRLSEPTPSLKMISERPELADEFRRPIFLLVAAVKATP